MDYWSLGIILYEFLVGITPFFGETVDEVFEFILNGKFLIGLFYIVFTKRKDVIGPFICFAEGSDRTG